MGKRFYSKAKKLNQITKSGLIEKNLVSGEEKKVGKRFENFTYRRGGDACTASQSRTERKKQKQKRQKPPEYVADYSPEAEKQRDKSVLLEIREAADAGTQELGSATPDSEEIAIQETGEKETSDTYKKKRKRTKRKNQVKKASKSLSKESIPVKQLYRQEHTSFRTGERQVEEAFSNALLVEKVTLQQGGRLKFRSRLADRKNIEKKMIGKESLQKQSNRRLSKKFVSQYQNSKKDGGDSQIVIAGNDEANIAVPLDQENKKKDFIPGRLEHRSDEETRHAFCKEKKNVQRVQFAQISTKCNHYDIRPGWNQELQDGIFPLKKDSDVSFKRRRKQVADYQPKKRETLIHNRDNGFIEEKNRVEENPVFFVPEEQSPEQQKQSQPPEQQKQSFSQEVKQQKQFSPQEIKQQKRIHKAEKRVQKREKQFHTVQKKLPYRRRIQLKRDYDIATGRVKYRPVIEKEAVQPGQKNIVSSTAEMICSESRHVVSRSFHQKIAEAERENVGVEAAHAVEKVGEQIGRAAYQTAKRHHAEKPYRRLNKVDQKLHKARAKLTYQKLLSDQPELGKKFLSRQFQKHKIKRSYAKEFRKTKQHFYQAKNLFVQVIRAVAQFVGVKKMAFAFVAAGIFIFVLCGVLMTSCSAMFSGVISAILSTCYIADDADITQCDLYYTEMEADLQHTINTVEETHPGYDRYRYNIGEISHSPYELLAYLTVLYDDFTFEQVRPALRDIFNEQYNLDIHSEIETHYRSDGSSYTLRVLVTTLSVKPLQQIFTQKLDNVFLDQYEVLLQTCGNRQAFYNPFSFPWIRYVETPFGYLMNESGEKVLHTGIDFAVPEGTPIMAIQDGSVTRITSGDRGMEIIVTDNKGYESRYANCDNVRVSRGQTVTIGQTIAEVGKKEDSACAAFHLEVLYHGEYMNPYFFVENGNNQELGGNTGPDISGNPGDAMGDGSYEALIAEAEKYLGYPYVWGGSTPQTSFDCSGFICWVYTHSGVHNLPRTTAQGIFNQCTPVSKTDARPGDIIFFTGTYSSPNPVTHVGIYVGNGQMLHCGEPIGYTSINTSYWRQHFYSFGRLSGITDKRSYQ